jgi:hypothetical protein
MDEARKGFGKVLYKKSVFNCNTLEEGFRVPSGGIVFMYIKSFFEIKAKFGEKKNLSFVI